MSTTRNYAMDQVYFKTRNKRIRIGLIVLQSTHTSEQRTLHTVEFRSPRMCNFITDNKWCTHSGYMEGCRLGTVKALVSIQYDYKQCIPLSHFWLLICHRLLFNWPTNY